MIAPRLTTVENAHPALVAQLPPLPVGSNVRTFVVTCDGESAAGGWNVGDVVVCRGDADDGDTVVLCAAGQGRPRLGSVRGVRLYGDQGEPCHPARWIVAGKVVATYRQTVHGWVVELLEPAAPVARRVGQLGLFDAVAA